MAGSGKEPDVKDLALRGVWGINNALRADRALMVDIVGFSVRAPQQEYGEMLMTIRGVDEDGARVVAFHSAMTLWDLLAGVEARLSNGSLKWKPDEYWNK